MIAIGNLPFYKYISFFLTKFTFRNDRPLFENHFFCLFTNFSDLTLIHAGGSHSNRCRLLCMNTMQLKSMAKFLLLAEMICIAMNLITILGQ